jgi:hypothetical protein
MHLKWDKVQIHQKLGIFILLLVIIGAFTTVWWFFYPRCWLPELSSDISEGEIISPAAIWNVTLGTRFIVPHKNSVPIYDITPDGHLSMLANPQGGWLMFWPEYESYRTWGIYPYPENQVILTPKHSVMGGRIDADRFNNGGSWLMSVARVNTTHLIGLVHAEDHWYPRNSEGIAWKSLGIAQSTDNGETWIEAEKILSCWVPKPSNPVWGGAGDGCMIWDGANSRWVCIYQEYDIYGLACLHLAISKDPLASPESWLKWDGQNFTATGLGGRGNPLPELRFHPGANPSLHWNTYLAKWIIVYGGWDNKTYISSTENLIEWSHPMVLIESNQEGRAWYPTIISDAGDTIAGEKATLYYADIAPDFSGRKFYGVPLQFSRSEI